MYSVKVLLAAYNGEKYLRQQLDSILNQRDVAVQILIHDDGSTDSTPEILEEYAGLHRNITYITDNNKGAVASFFTLFENALDSSELYALSDQDDVWDEDKLLCACNMLSSMQVDSDTPALYCCNSRVTDQELNILEENTTRLTPDFKNALVENIARGGGIVFNNALLRKATVSATDGIFMHDWWLYLVGSAFGKVVYDPECHYCYRQHSGNVLGASSKGFAKLKRRIRQSKQDKGHVFRQAKAFFDFYGVPEAYSESLNTILLYRQSLKYRLLGMFGRKIFRQKKSDEIIFRLLFLTNRL